MTKTKNPAASSTPDKLLVLDKVATAELCNVSVQTIQRDTATGVLVSLKIRKSVRYLLSDVVDYLQRHRRRKAVK